MFRAACYIVRGIKKKNWRAARKVREFIAVYGEVLCR
jgi:hypothetical protein